APLVAAVLGKQGDAAGLSRLQVPYLDGLARPADGQRLAVGREGEGCRQVISGAPTPQAAPLFARGDVHQDDVAGLEGGPDQEFVIGREGPRRAAIAREDLAQFLAGRQLLDVNGPETVVVGLPPNGEVLPPRRNKGDSLHDGRENADAKAGQRPGRAAANTVA